jgi:hypothetical protein
MKLFFRIGKKGLAGQIIMSVVIVFAVFFLMLVFVIVSSNIAGVLGILEKDKVDEEFTVLSQERINSWVLMDLFLSDSVKINGKEIGVQRALMRFIGEDEKPEPGSFPGAELRQVLIDKFSEGYSCDGKNSVIFEQSGPAGKLIILKYPGDASSVEQGTYSKILTVSPETYPGYFGSTRDAILYVREETKC